MSRQKDKVFFPFAHHKGLCDIRGLIPVVLEFCTGWRGVDGFTLGSLYSQEPMYSAVNRSVVGEIWIYYCGD
jgi:hypothetical protein